MTTLDEFDGGNACDVVEEMSEATLEARAALGEDK